MADITLKAMPFDSNEVIDPETGETTYDRVAYSRDLADWMRAYFSNGVLVRGGNVLGDQLRVVHKEGLTLTVKAGEVCINGRTGWLEADTDITVEMGGAQPRIDRVVVELNIPNDRGIYIKVLQGIPAANPTPPELSRTEDNYVLSIAQVHVSASSATIQSITDERPDPVACGLSNVTIGIKPPTGNDANTVSASLDLSGHYAFPSIVNIESLLYRAVDLSSYMTFCGNVNQDIINAALGYRNENNVHLIGRQLSMYAKFKGVDLESYPEEHAALLTCDTVAEIAKNSLAGALILRIEPLFNLLSTSAFSYFKLENIPQALYDAVGRVLGVTVVAPNYNTFWTNSNVLVKMANRGFNDAWTNKMLSKIFSVDGNLALCDTIFNAAKGDTVHFNNANVGTDYDHSSISFNDRGFVIGTSATGVSSSTYKVTLSSTNGTGQTVNVQSGSPNTFKHYLYFPVVSMSGSRGGSYGYLSQVYLKEQFQE